METFSGDLCEIPARQLDDGELETVNGGHIGIAVLVVVLVAIRNCRTYQESKK